jgi:DnaJ-class molecular chaperone
MRIQMKKSRKIALCRRCHGVGLVGTELPSTCPQCQGSGRVLVSAYLDYDIRPYKDKSKA